jgi:hypothetical protein
MAHTTEPFSRESIDKTSVVCDYVSAYTYDMLKPVMTSHLKIILVLHIISSNFIRFDSVFRISFFHVTLQPNTSYGLLIHEVFEITHTTRQSR